MAVARGERPLTAVTFAAVASVIDTNANHRRELGTLEGSLEETPTPITAFVTTSLVPVASL